MFGNISGKKITILGFAFKSNTNDTRQSPCISICKDLLDEGAYLSIYDPKVEKHKINDDLKNIQDKNPNNQGNGDWEVCSSIEKAAVKSDAIVVLTEWKEFCDIDWNHLIKLMRTPSWVFDTRACINPDNAKKAGFNIWEIGNSYSIYK